MAETYKRRHGVDWSPDMHDTFIDLTVAKKWREYKAAYGVEFKDPWIPLIDAAKALIPEQYFKVPPWTEEHFHDWVMAEKGCITWGCASCGKSNDYGLLMVLDWITDPYDTVIRLGSTDKQSLKSRSWNAVVTYFAALKRNQIGVTIPGKFSKSGYAVLNDDADDSPEAAGEKAGILGVAVNDSEDSGKLQGAHTKYVRIVIDELATITHHENIRKAMQNLRVGAKDFRFFALANPASWEDESCQYCLPPGGVDSVNVDTGLWTSTKGFLVRHHDGLKCITVTNPEKVDEFPFLLTKEVVDSNLSDCDGNEDAPLFWQMVRGFPPPTGTSIPTVLDPAVAKENHVMDPPPAGAPVVASAAGIDPAWSEGGDGACLSKVLVRQPSTGYPILDFSPFSRLHIHASDPRPVSKQLLDQTRLVLDDPGGYPVPLANVAVDASGNQGLADDIDIFIGQGTVCVMHVNNSQRASEYPIRANTEVKGFEEYKDRAAEAWCVLAAFCKAGMVRGLPRAAYDALVKRRFLTTKGSSVPKKPLALERKDDFKARVFKRSPDEADACALGALVVKERLGILPFGWAPRAAAPLVNQGDYAQASSLAPSQEFAEGDCDGIDALDLTE